MTNSPDGFIRMAFDTLQRTDFSHIISVVEDEERHAAQRVVSGYTEWASEITPRISIGWDWQLSIDGAKASICKAGSPRINVMLIDATEGDLGFWESVNMVDHFIDTLAWEHVVRATLDEPLADVVMNYS